ncbi:DNA-binding protein [Cupriavidus taiwanensis]|uniref:DNA-binding protein n=1 Tax=Cupriavidus taiwanensis TaxID=164546 RepID=UPI000E1010F7|nr:DNA-binding protein [Cupriavidus taiwanensis]SOY50560.1 DNA-binding protein [Cupriavidus taiwanensis]SOY50830.1 DNA-binding protein [Cupriavidus taiwanensis]SOY83723.1 DNA-binding protein [Cupriavidus taiwanensis]SOZ57946.1 DNA-binding protein [Cupriavidus taiwanensis]SOZ79758.1 DNA-binding protein [Cupriavidus taiwanensis]
MEYAFTLRYQLSADDSDPDTLVERLYEAGCDDATVGTGVVGRIAIAFDREAESAADAIVSALTDARRAMPSATLIEAAPDLVGLTDIADTVGMSRQNMRKLMLGHPASFPPPVHEGASSLWHLWEALLWMSRKGYEIEPSLIEVAAAAMQVNLARSAGNIVPAMERRIRKLVA